MSTVHDRRAAATLAAVQEWVQARADRRAIARERRALNETCRAEEWSMFSRTSSRLRVVDNEWAAARKRERQALEAVARASGAEASRRSNRADVRVLDADGIIVHNC
jgi:hypothetical protein